MSNFAINFQGVWPMVLTGWLQLASPLWRGRSSNLAP